MFLSRHVSVTYAIFCYSVCCKINLCDISVLEIVSKRSKFKSNEYINITDDSIGLAETFLKAKKYIFAFSVRFYSCVCEPKIECLNLPIFYLGGKYLQFTYSNSQSSGIWFPDNSNIPSNIFDSII